MAIIDKATVKVAQQTIIIPEHIDYPDNRITLNSGLLKKGDVVVLNVKVLDNKGGVKLDESIKVAMAEYAIASDQEVLGVATLSFNESPLPKAIADIKAEAEAIGK